MYLIDKYLNSLHNRYKDKKSLELKAEMKQHLIDTVEYLKSEGLSEEETVKIAIERFGDSHFLSRDLHNFLQSHKSLCKKLFIVALITFILGSLSFAFGIISNRLDAGFGQLDSININNFDSELPLEASESELLDNMIERKILNKVVYFNLYKLENTTSNAKGKPRFDDLTEDEMLKDKNFIEAYTYGSPTDNIYA